MQLDKLEDKCVPVKPSPQSMPWTYPSPPKVSSCPYIYCNYYFIKGI